LRSLRYIDRLTWFQRATIIAKLFVPHALMIRRG
jgi:hypothetical protein